MRCEKENMALVSFKISLAVFALASGVLNGNGLGGLFGNQNPSTSPVYQLAQKDNEIALLKAQQYSDNKIAVLTERVSNLEARVLADEKTDPGIRKSSPTWISVTTIRTSTGK